MVGHFFAIIQGWDQLVSAVLGILGAALAALGPKLVELASDRLDDRKKDRQASGPGYYDAAGQHVPWSNTQPPVPPSPPPSIEGDQI